MERPEEKEGGIITCAKCGDAPDDVLILTCDHNLCLRCAGANLNRERQKSKHSFQTVVCDICGSATVLDPASATELLAQVQTQAHRKTWGIKPEKKEAVESRPKKYPLPQMPKPMPTPTATTPSEDYCPSHPDEPVKYFCFDCLTPPVCSECVIQGIHKGHDVLHIKKAFPLIREKLEAVVQGLTSRVDELQNDQKLIEARKASDQDQAMNAKSQIQTMLSELRFRIDKKEKEIEENIERSIEENQHELESYERILEGKLETVVKNINYIRENVKEGPREALTFYAENNKLLSQVIEQEMKNKDQYSTQVSKMKNPIGTEAIRNLKEIVNEIAESVSSLSLGPVTRISSDYSKQKNEGLSYHEDEY